MDFKAGLYTDEFTIETWIKPQWTQKTDYEHTLVGAGGYYVRTPVDQSPSWHGFWIFADGKDRWRVYLAQSDGSGVVDIQPASPTVAHNVTTYLAVTVEADKVTIFVNGNLFGQSSEPYDYSAPDGAPFFIGVKNIESDPSNSAVPRNPVLSSLQEVVLYDKVLSPADIKKHYDIGMGKSA